MRTLCALLAVSMSVATALAQSTAFTYQGQLKEGSAPASGVYDLRFRLYNATTGGTQIGSTLCADNVLVAGGLFTVALDFGQQFVSTFDRTLEIEVRRDTGLNCANTGGYTMLTPRQPLTPTPRATAATTANALAIPNGSSVLVNLTDNGFVGVGTFAPTSQLHLNAVQDAFKITANQPYMTLVDTNAGNARVLLQNESGRYFVTSESFLNGTNSGGFTMVDAQGRFAIGTFSPVGPLDARATGGNLSLTDSGNVGIGTALPTAKLDVRGDIRLGASGQFKATAGDENLRIIRGTIAANGAIIRGSGFTCTRTTVGRYSIVLNTPFSGMPTVVGSGGDNTDCFVHTGGVATTDFVILLGNIVLNGESTDQTFNFMAIGPR